MGVLINILTRTSNRPLFFKNNADSVTKQTYKNVKHIVSCDDESDLNYINGCGVKPIMIDREYLIKNDTSKNPNTGKYSPHNLYFNELLKEVKEGWVIVLDDDDEFIDENSLQKIVDSITSDDEILIWQMKFNTNGLVLPPTNMMDKPPALGRIGSPCIAFNIKSLGDIKFDGWKCGDFRFIDSLYKKIKNRKIISEPLVLINQVGLGNKKDKK